MMDAYPDIPRSRGLIYTVMVSVLIHAVLVFGWITLNPEVLQTTAHSLVRVELRSAGESARALNSGETEPVKHPSQDSMSPPNQVASSVEAKQKPAAPKQAEPEPSSKLTKVSATSKVPANVDVMMPLPVTTTGESSMKVASSSRAEPVAVEASVDLEQQRLKEQYKAMLRAWADANKVYPRRAIMRGIEGDVSIQITIQRNGQVMAHEVVESSGSGLLDRAAIDVLAQARDVPSFPPEFRPDSLTLTLPFRYRLTGT